MAKEVTDEIEIGTNKPPQKQAADQLADGRFAKGNKLGKRFQPGQSGNPGGNYRRTPKVSLAYARLLAMTPEEIAAFRPTNGAEELALARFIEALHGHALHPMLPLHATKEITDRTEGKAKAVVEVKPGGELDVLIARIQERARAELGIEVTREAVIEKIRAYKPELVDGLDG